MGWKEEAACRGQGIAPFFNRRTQAEKDTAEALCGSCPVRLECLEYAISHERSENLRIGIWGGMNPNERAEWASE